MGNYYESWYLRSSLISSQNVICWCRRPFKCEITSRYSWEKLFAYSLRILKWCFNQPMPFPSEICMKKEKQHCNLQKCSPCMLSATIMMETQTHWLVDRRCSGFVMMHFQRRFFYINDKPSVRGKITSFISRAAFKFCDFYFSFLKNELVLLTHWNKQDPVLIQVNLMALAA